jgi:hypothetical protein
MNKKRVGRKGSDADSLQLLTELHRPIVVEPAETTMRDGYGRAHSRIA